MVEIMKLVEPIIGTVVGAVVACLLGVLVSKYAYLTDYQKNVDDLLAKADQLRSRKQDIESQILARSYSNQVRNEVAQWLQRAGTELSKYDLKMSTKIVGKTGCCRPWWGWRWWMGRKVAKNAAKFGTIIESGNFAGDIFEQYSLPASRPLIRSVSDAKCQLLSSSKDAFEMVMDGLRDANVSIIGVHGMGGVGKTTMIKRVMEKVKEENLFVVVMVTVSKPPVSVSSIQGKIGEQLELDFRGIQSEEARANQLMRGITKGKRVLIVLDDVWNELSLANVGIPDLKNSESKILLAARNRDVCTAMGSSPVVHLKTWSEEASWSLMKETSGLPFDDSNFERVGRRVAKECGGLPLALVAVAKALKEQDIKGWEKALLKLQNNDPFIPDAVYKSLELSYDFLIRDEDKEYFRMCCLFPEDHNISREELARYGMGLGWYRAVRTMERARDRGDQSARRLISSGLLLEGDKDGQVKMHDVVRDFSIWMTSLERVSDEPGSSEVESKKPIYEAMAGQALTRWPKMEPRHYNAISVMFNKIQSLPFILDSPELKILLLQENTNLNAIHEDFFQKTNSLKVLSMSNIRVSSLPNSISSLFNLRTLCLDHHFTKDVSVIGELVNLEILSLKHSAIDVLPMGIGNLTKLRVLDLAFCIHIHSIPRKVIQGLTSLEELYLQESFAKWNTEVSFANGENIEGDACFSDIMNMPFLTILKVDIEDPRCMPLNVNDSPKWKEFSICISDSQHNRSVNAHASALRADSRNLVIGTSMNHLPEWFIKLVLSKAEWLMYIDCYNLDLVKAYDNGVPSDLKSLIVEYCNGTMPLMSFNDDSQTQPVFESLQQLWIQYINRKEICVGELPPRSLENLEFLGIQQCASLKNSLLTSNLIKRLNKLKRLNASGSIDVTEVFGFEGLPGGLTVLQALEEMRLDKLSITSLWKGSPTFMRFNKLKCMIVTECKKLINLFSESVAENLIRLEVLWIESCTKMEEIINNSEQITTHTIILPELKTITLQNLNAFRGFYLGNATLELPLLEHIYVKDCPSFTSTMETIKNDEQHSKLLRRKYKHLFES